MVNMMREHVPEDTRIHYVITSGGSAPNVVPDFAEVYYYVRHPDARQVAAIFDRVVKAAEGAAMGTGTTVDYEIVHAVYAMLPNDVLGRVMDRNLRRVGGIEYTVEERAFAEKIQTTFPEGAPPLSSAREIAPYRIGAPGGGSTDVSDVSWVVPTVGLDVATWVPGTAAHSWQAVAAGGTSIGMKGMLVAAKTLALTAIDLFTTPNAIADAKAEYRKDVGPNFVYRALVGDRPPPLDYRAKQ
jgi:aminobenzoyl-glutamate utilization protein B